MVSHWFAWISFGLSILVSAKFLARKSKIKKLNLGFSKAHKPLSVAMILLGLAHGIIDGVKTDENVAVIVTGALLLATAVFLLLTWLFRKRFKIWMKAHRIGSLVFLGFLLTHLILALI